MHRYTVKSVIHETVASFNCLQGSIIYLGLEEFAFIIVCGGLCFKWLRSVEASPSQSLVALGWLTLCVPLASPVHADSSVLSQPGNLGTVVPSQFDVSSFNLPSTGREYMPVDTSSLLHLSYICMTMRPSIIFWLPPLRLGFGHRFFGNVGWPPLFSSSLASYPIVDCFTHIFWLTPYSGSRIQSPLDFVTFNLQRPWSWKLWHQTAHHRAKFARFLPS